MKLRRFSLAVCAFAFASFGLSQQPASPPDQTQPPIPAPPPGQTAAQAQSPNPDAGPGQGGRGYGRGMGMGQGLVGTVTQVASDHFTVKNMAGENWTVKFDENTWIMRQQPQTSGPNGQQELGGYGRKTFKLGDLRVGEGVMTGGKIDNDAKSVSAVGIMVLDPTRAEQMRQMQANYGKTWLAGRVTSINDTTITVQGSMDSTAHTFVADENTTFRRRREPITLADVQVGDNVRVEGAVKDGQFVAAMVNVMMPPAVGGPVPRQGPPPQ